MNYHGLKVGYSYGYCLSHKAITKYKPLNSLLCFLRLDTKGDTCFIDLYCPRITRQIILLLETNATHCKIDRLLISVELHCLYDVTFAGLAFTLCSSQSLYGPPE